MRVEEGLVQRHETTSPTGESVEVGILGVCVQVEGKRRVRDFCALARRTRPGVEGDSAGRVAANPPAKQPTDLTATLLLS